MSILDALAGRRQLLTFEVAVRSDLAAVSMVPSAQGISPEEYVRLWMWYECKLVFGYGGAGSEGAVLTLETVSALALAADNPGEDSFSRAGFRGVRLVTRVPDPTYRVTGRYFARGTGRRISVSFPFGPRDARDLTAVALFEWARLAQRGDEQNLASLASACRKLHDVLLVQGVSPLAAAERTYAQCFGKS